MKRSHWENVGKKEFQRVADALKKHVAAWIPILGLDSWEIEINYHAAPFEDSHVIGQVGRAQVTWKYKEATIDFFLSGMTESSPERLEYIAVHELMHVVVNQMRGTMDWDRSDLSNEERVVTELARAFIRRRK